MATSARVALRPYNEAPRPAVWTERGADCQLGGDNLPTNIVALRLQLVPRPGPILARHFFREGELIELPEGFRVYGPISAGEVEL
jgi:hypothetical protein